jgi:amidase
VQDVALMLAAIAGPEARSPISLPEPGAHFLTPLDRDWQDMRLAWSPTLGELPVQNEVLGILERALPAFHTLGCQIERADPDLRWADQVFRVLRAWRFDLQFAELLRTHRAQLKDTIIWNAEEGSKLSGRDVARAEQLRTRLFHRMQQFFERYDFLLAPVVQVLPFDVQQPYVREINGQTLATYIDWMKSCYWISVTGLPALSVPAGFSQGGLPVGLQIVGRPQDDLGVLQLAYGFQQVTEFWRRRPPPEVIDS